MNIINCIAGSQKIQKIIKDINNIKEKTQDESFLILTLNQNKKEQINFAFNGKNIPIFFFDEFAKNLLKKCPSNVNAAVISDFLATTIIHSLEKQEFIQNKSLKNLTKSTAFSRELYNLISLLKINRADFDTLVSVTDKSNISQEDKTRFKIILNVYKKYNEFLKSNNFYDFRDVILNCIDFLNNNEVLRKTYQQKYKYIFIDSAENINSLQLELLKIFTSEENIYLYGDINAKINSFMGANIFKKEEYNLKTTCRNEDILKRALYMVTGKYSNFAQTDAIKYKIFNNSEDEIEFIAKDILSSIKNEKLNYSDFTILLRNNSMKQEVVDLLKNFGISVSGELMSDEYQDFKCKFTNIIDLCNFLKKIDLKTFDKKGFENVFLVSSVDLKHYAQEINILLKQYLNEKLENKYILENIDSIREKTNELFLLNTILKNLSRFNEKDKEIITKNLNTIAQIYKFFLNNDFLQIILKITDIINLKDEVYIKFLAKFMKNLNEFLKIKRDILKEDIETETIFDLMEFTIEENSYIENKINIMTIFKASGLEFEKVYIPYLTENYFPKKVKNTFFITKEANNILSKEIQDKYINFNKIIISAQEELEEEEKLLYTAMTRAKTKLFLSTHKYEDKKQAIPSAFFEQLVFSDKENLLEGKKKEIPKEEKKEIERKNKIIEKIIKSEPVLNKNIEFPLSVSGIKDFLQCPRKFYYGRLLELKGEDPFYISYGNIVHSIFENFLSKHLDEFSKETLKNLGLTLFNSVNDKQAALNAGFDINSTEQIEALSLLSLEEMKKDFLEAVDNVEKTGFFEKQPINAGCEKNFKFKMQEFPNIIFNGKIDAIIKYSDGIKLIDYKTGKSKKELGKEILPAISKNFFDDEGNLKEEELDKAKAAFEYQIPLYCFACENDNSLSNYKDVNKLGYQYIHNNKKSKNSDIDFIDKEIISQNKDQIINNLKTFVIDKMYEKTFFEATPSNNCKNCNFMDICEKENNGENDD